MNRALELLSISSELSLGKTTDTVKPRVLPPGLRLAVWLNRPMVFSVLLCGIMLLVVSWAVKFAEIPVSLALMFDRASILGTIDSVQPRARKQRQASGRLTEIGKEFVHSYHFTLPGGKTYTGTSVSPFDKSRSGIANVKVEYYPRRPHLNRIQGMSADEGQHIYWLAIVLVSMIVVSSYRGLRQAITTQKLLRSGSLGWAVVTHCLRASSGLKGFSKQPESQGNLVPLLDYRQQMIEAHREAFDENGNFIGTLFLRRLSLAFAAGFGGVGGAILAMALSLAFLYLTGRQPNPPVLLACFGIGFCLGAILFIFGEWRWRYFLRHNANGTREGLPSGFQNCKCILECATGDGLDIIRLEKTIDLKGDASDIEPHPILHLKESSKTARLLSDVELEYERQPTGELIIRGAAPQLRLLVVLAICLASCVGVAMIV